MANKNHRKPKPKAPNQSPQAPRLASNWRLDRKLYSFTLALSLCGAWLIAGAAEADPSVGLVALCTGLFTLMCGYLRFKDIGLKGLYLIGASVALIFFPLSLLLLLALLALPSDFVSKPRWDKWATLSIALPPILGLFIALPSSYKTSNEARAQILLANSLGLESLPAQTLGNLVYGPPEEKQRILNDILSEPENHSPLVLFAASAELLSQGKRQEALLWYQRGHLRALCDACLLKNQEAQKNIELLIPALGDKLLEGSDPNSISPSKESKEMIISWEKTTPKKYNRYWVAAYDPHYNESSGAKSPDPKSLLIAPELWEGTEQQTLEKYKNQGTSQPQN